MTVHDFTVKDTHKNDVSLADYKGKVLLIVNTATGCGFTPQFEGLELLYKQYKDQGLEILSFPSNQFLNQAPGSDEEIVSFCTLNYGVSFKTFAKIDVNGKNAAPLYTYLKQQHPEDQENAETKDFKKLLVSLAQNIVGTEIKWNFTKFLVDRDGKVVARFAPTVKPAELAPHIEKLLKA
jgi:glutathione peroxidase